MIVLSGFLQAQDGQHTSRPNWPCVAGRAVDPTYLEVSESTGGQLFWAQKGEFERTAPVLSASFTHPATILRAVGHLSGSRDLEFPVESGVESLLLLVSVQCRNAILVTRPSGSEVTDRNSALSTDLAAGRILRVDQPDAGKWRVRLTGSGLFVLSVLAKSNLALTDIAFFAKRPAAEGEERGPRLVAPLFGVAQDLEIRLAGQISHLGVELVDASCNRLSSLDAPEVIGEGRYRTSVESKAERFRVLVSGEDSSAWPFQRMYPVLFRAQRAK
jgi:hypothetical protein